jgi:FkbM family methyltransferase
MTAAKQRRKTMLPRTVVRVANRVYRKLAHRSRPRLRAFPGVAPGVLQCCIAYNEYGGYCVPLASLHRPAAQKILAGAVWEPETIDFLVALGKGGDIVHAGTFFGDFLPALSASTSGTVWAFEPHPENFRCAELTLRLNALENVELVKAGLGDRKATVSMEISNVRGRPLGGASRIIDASNLERGRTVDIGIVTIDAMIPPDRKVAVIQLDVEGYEQLALAGALETIRRCRPVLVIETVPEQSWLESHILSLGYRITGQVSAQANTILRPA